MRYFGKLSGLLILLLLSGTSCKSYEWSGSSSVSCGYIIGSATHCTITFSSAKYFDWTASSTVAGVTIQPSSGAEAAGMSSGAIHVTIPSCPGSSGAYIGSLNFTDDAHDLMLIINIVSAGGGVCTLKS